MRTASKVSVSVVIPCYRCADTIGRAVESVMAQTSLPAEVWLIEDGSDDDGQTLAKLHELQRRYHDKSAIEVIPLGRNCGAPTARNRGWDASTQQYVAFLDADDAWHPRKLEIQYVWMEAHPDAAMSGHKWPWIRPRKPTPSLPERWEAWRVSPLRQLIGSRFSTPTVMVRRDIPYRFNESARFNDDFDLWLRILLDGHAAWRLELPLTYVYHAPYGQGGLSGNLWKMERAQLDTYWRQVHEGRLPFIALAFLVPWSLVKFLRRLVISTRRSRAALQ